MDYKQIIMDFDIPDDFNVIKPETLNIHFSSNERWKKGYTIDECLYYLELHIRLKNKSIKNACKGKTIIVGNGVEMHTQSPTPRAFLIDLIVSNQIKKYLIELKNSEGV